MDRSFTYTVSDLAHDESVTLRCDCRVRTYSRAELAALVGRDARLRLVGLHRTLRCHDRGEPPFTGWVASAVPGRPWRTRHPPSSSPSAPRPTGRRA